MTYVRDLDIYNKALHFSNKIWEICIRWDHFAKRTIGEQLTRSADSISANIAEGYGRRSVKDNIRFCFYARGSLEETKDWLAKAESRKLLTKETSTELNDQIVSISKELWRYIESLQKKLNT